MPSKRKKTALPRKKKTNPKPSKSPIVPKLVPVLSASFLDRLRNHWAVVLLAADVALWLASRWGVFPQAEKVFLVTGLLLFASFFIRLNNLRYVLVMIGMGFVLMALSVGANPFFSYVFSFWPGFHLSDPLITLGIGLGFLIGFWRFLPPADPAQDISEGWARLWFWGLFAVAAFLRLNRVHEPVGCYWDDLAVAITDPRGIMEFHEHPLLMPIANREPLYPYFFAGLWSLMPDAYAIFVQRLGSGLLDLIGVWLFYLLGKEVGGRRVGLIAAALAAVSKPLLIAVVTGASNVTAPMSVALLMLMTFRLFKKQDWKHFFYWGLALGVLPYSYTSVRPWLLFIVTVVFFWIWFHKQGEGKVKADLFLGWGSLAAWSFAFLVIHHFLPIESPWVVFFCKGWVRVAFLALMGFYCYSSLRASRPVGVPALVPRFFISLLLAALILYPLASNPLIGVHAAGFSIFHSHTDLSVHVGLDTIKLFLNKIGDSLHTMFISGEDRGDMNLTLDAFLDYHFIPLLALGLVSLLVQPSWTKLFLLVGGFVGISPHILSVDGHSGRLVCGLVPLAVIAGQGVEQVYQSLKAALPKRAVVGFSILLALAYFGWAIWGSYEKVWNAFFEGGRVEKTVSLQVKQFSRTARVYIARYPLFVSFVTQCLLDQGYDVYSLETNNAIYLSPGEQPKDAVVLYHVYDKETDTKILGRYKNTVKEMINLVGWPDKRGTCWRVVVPAAEITDNPHDLFYFQTKPDSNWTRSYLAGRYILGYGVIELEDSVADLYDPIHLGAGGRLVNMKGHFQMAAGSRVTFRVRTNDFVKFQVDGRKLFYLNPDWVPLPASKTVDLSAGNHQVEYDIWLQHEQTIPKIWMSVNGGPDQLLGQPSGAPSP